MSGIKKLPVGWKNIKLKKLVTHDIKNGYSPNCPEEPNGSWILGLGNLTENGFDSSHAKPAPVNDKRVKDFLLASGDFLISRSNTLDKVGRTMLFRGEIENCSYPDLLMRFRVDETQVLNEFLESYLKSSTVRKYIQSCASGTSGSMVKINKTAVENITVIFPPCPEQKAIADLLSTWDEAIEKTACLIQEKVRRFKWLRSSLIRDEKEWTEVKLGGICKVTKGEQLNVAHMKADGSYYALNGGIKPSGRTDDWNTEAGIITISEGGNSCGYVNFNTERFWSGGHCYSLLKVKKSVNMHYLFFYLKMNEPKLMNLRVGSGLPNIQKKDVDRIKVSFPTLSEQQQIAQTLNAAQQEIDILDQMLNKYKTLKRGLMQKMLTGEWRVKPEIVNQYMEA
ncbi:MAG: restriction endonuclease subunit S [Chlorobium sp.]|nr:restriction endonuclease subunit S [Chlorobium sp.]